MTVTEREALFGFFIEAVKDYAIFMLDPSGHVLTWNVGAERLKGYTAAEILGRSFTVFYTPEDQAAGRPAHLLAVAREAGRVEEEGWRVRRDGSRFWADVVITAVRDNDGRLLGFGKVTRDMTEVRARHEELEATNTELRHANDALETFARSMTHDIGGPLRTMQGFAEILLRDHQASLDAKARNYLDRIVAGAERLSDLTQGLLAYFRMVRSGETPPTEPISWDVTADTVMRELKPDIDRTGAAVEIQGPLGRVVGYRELLVIALDNFLRNAIKYVAPGVPPEVTVFSERHGEWLRLNVRDNGIGIRPDEQRVIFEPFTRLHTRARYPGSGLGLSIVAEAVGRLGGRCGVTSASGRGSCFWIDLPAA